MWEKNPPTLCLDHCSLLFSWKGYLAPQAPCQDHLPAPHRAGHAPLTTFQHLPLVCDNIPPQCSLLALPNNCICASAQPSCSTMPPTAVLSSPVLATPVHNTCSSQRLLLCYSTACDAEQDHTNVFLSFSTSSCLAVVLSHRL